MTKQETDPRTFIVTADGWVAGRFARAGERVMMSRRDARYEPRLAEPAAGPRRKRAARPAPDVSDPA